MMVAAPPAGPNLGLAVRIQALDGRDSLKIRGTKRNL